MFMYCKRCGFMPAKYLTQSGLLFSSRELRREFEEAIKSAPEYINSANVERIKIIAEKDIINEKII